MAGWTLEPDYRHLAADFGSLDSVRPGGERLTRDPLSEVIRIERDGVRYYVKRYRSAGKGLRCYLARPRIKAEGRTQALREVGHSHRRSGRLGAGAQGRRLPARRHDSPASCRGTESDRSVLACNRDPRLKDPRWVDGASAGRSPRLRA